MKIGTCCCGAKRKLVDKVVELVSADVEISGAGVIYGRARCNRCDLPSYNDSRVEFCSFCDSGVYVVVTVLGSRAKSSSEEVNLLAIQAFLFCQSI